MAANSRGYGWYAESNRPAYISSSLFQKGRGQIERKRRKTKEMDMSGRERKAKRIFRLRCAVWFVWWLCLWPVVLVVTGMVDCDDL